ncbi:MULTISPECIES: hypothetical protein [unclassified Microcoleus]|uniref:hypothetical protein n=1 Tax=unclassified Microcoleus TaxID=2642155 RepID=UPI002FD6761F
MAITKIYGERNLRAVSIPLGGSTAFYVFKTNVDASEVTELGQIDAATLLGGGPAAPVFVGIGKSGRPRPARLKKRKEGITSLASTANIATAIASRKWQMVRRAVFQGKVAQKSTSFGTPIAGGDAAKGSILVAVTTSGLNWAWRMPAQQFNKISSAQATALGISIPNTDLEFRNLVVNANLPRPGRAFHVLSTTDNTFRVETFIGDSATLPDGWTGIGQALKYGG